MYKRFVLILIVLLFHSGCEDQGVNSTSKRIEAKINTGEIYVYNLGNFGDEEGARIITPPQHAELSELNRTDHAKLVYRYKPAEGYTGQDYIKLQSERGSNGASPNTEIQVAEIYIVISD